MRRLKFVGEGLVVDGQGNAEPRRVGLEIRPPIMRRNTEGRRQNMSISFTTCGSVRFINEITL
jgi:hypothetical protein